MIDEHSLTSILNDAEPLFETYRQERSKKLDPSMVIKSSLANYTCAFCKQVAQQNPLFCETCSNLACKDCSTNCCNEPMTVNLKVAEALAHKTLVRCNYCEENEDTYSKHMSQHFYQCKDTPCPKCPKCDAVPCGTREALESHLRNRCELLHRVCAKCEVIVTFL